MSARAAAAVFSISLSLAVYTHTRPAVVVCVLRIVIHGRLLQQQSAAAKTNSARSHTGPGTAAFVFPSSAPRILITSKHNGALTHPAARSKSNNARERPVVSERDVCVTSERVLSASNACDGRFAFSLGFGSAVEFTSVSARWFTPEPL